MTLASAEFDELATLLTELREQTITDTGWAKLEHLLRTSADARRFYADAATVWSCLARLSDSHEISHAPATAPQKIAASRPPSNRRFALLARYAVAAAIVVAFTAAVSFLTSLSRPDVTHRAGSPIATLIDSTDAQWGSCDVPTSVGSQLPGGFLRLRSGIATVEFFSGARVTLIGPCEFGLNSPMRGLLRRGRLSAYCPPSAHGFTIGAPECAVMDLGTRFRMEINAAGLTRITVEQGKVRLTSADRTVALAAHQQARVAAAGKVEVAFAGPIPLGTLFDDAPGTPLAQAVASDEVGAVAHTGGLGVERVQFSNGSNIAQIAPGISLNFGPLNWKQPSTLRRPTNRDWSNVPGETGLSTTGLPRRGKPKSEPGIGMHANLLVTFDLDAIRDAGDISRDTAMRFISDRAGLDDSAAPGSAPIHLIALVSDGRQVLAAYVEGRAVHCVRSGANWSLPDRLPPPITRTGHFVRFNVPLSPAARYLTLVSVAAGPYTNNTHGAFAAARLELQPSLTFKGEEQ